MYSSRECDLIIGDGTRLNLIISPTSYSILFKVFTSDFFSVFLYLCQFNIHYL